MDTAILCLDVQYYQENGKDKGHVAAGYTSNYKNERFDKLFGLTIEDVEEYEPGSFYKRELPCLMKMANKIYETDIFWTIDYWIIDGYVYLDDHIGLGGHFCEDLTKEYSKRGGILLRLPVIGVAKTAYKGSDFAEKVYRGSSNSPLFITAECESNIIAASMIKSMHGQNRIPTLLKEVDRAARNLSFVNF